jgi:hypothetical protein
MCEKRDMARVIVHDVVGSAMDTDPIPDPVAVIPPSWWEGTFSEWIDYETAGPYYTYPRKFL